MAPPPTTPADAAAADDERAATWASALSTGTVDDPTLGALLAALPAETAAFRRAMTARLLRALEAPEPSPGALAAWPAVAALLVDELLDRCTLESAWRLLERHDAGAAVAGLLLPRLPAAVGLLGPGRLRALGSSANAAHRAVAVAAIASDPRAVLRDLAFAANLAELEHDDVRGAICRALDAADARSWTAARLALLLHASHADVRAAALGLARAQASSPALDRDELIVRLAGHPAPEVRALVVELAEAASVLSPPAFRALARTVRAALLAVDDRGDDDARALAVLVRFGVAGDRTGAEIAAAVLADAADLADPALGVERHRAVLAARHPGVGAAGAAVTLPDVLVADDAGARALLAAEDA